MAGGEQMGARTLFAAMPRAGEPAYDADRDMLDISGESRQKLEGGLKACIMPISVGLGLQVAELGHETSSKKNSCIGLLVAIVISLV